MCCQQNLSVDIHIYNTTTSSDDAQLLATATVAQSVEHMTFNHSVAGSSPVGGMPYGSSVASVQRSVNRCAQIFDPRLSKDILSQTGLVLVWNQVHLQQARTCLGV